MPRFHCQIPLTVGAEIILPEAVAHHVQVLRLAPGDGITLFNGEGGEYAAILTTVAKRQARALVQAFVPREAELPYALTLAQALPEGAKMDWIIEKAVELGVAEVAPVAARRSVVRLSAERVAKKLEHWQGINASAAEQCGRNRLTRLREPVAVEDWLAGCKVSSRILFSPRATQSLSDWVRGRAPQDLAILIGPEGGLTEEEEAAALRHKFVALSLGPRVLRTETAGLAAVAAINAIWGQM
ncbi:MAG TPA: 16S rRNA (uracil(1498)-N(3))-methyltransferase [Noviherbaspirillum sp.]|nr:16S rRNA (uracil(1498)-N(3))-methyltransferase [Noviherbaspirillum sp.]